MSIHIAGLALTMALEGLDKLADIWIKVDAHNKQEDRNDRNEAKRKMFDPAAREILSKIAAERTRKRLGLNETFAEFLIDPIELAKDRPDLSKMVPMVREILCRIMQPEKLIAEAEQET